MYGVPPPGTGAGNRRGTRLIVIGAIVFFAGMVITIASFAAAAGNLTGGTYVVMVGPLIGGAAAMIQGGIEVSRARGGIRARANWYPDPQDPRMERYWDGRAWTGHVRPPAG